MLCQPSLASGRWLLWRVHPRRERRSSATAFPTDHAAGHGAGDGARASPRSLGEPLPSQPRGRGEAPGSAARPPACPRTGQRLQGGFGRQQRPEAEGEGQDSTRVWNNPSTKTPVFFPFSFFFSGSMYWKTLVPSAAARSAPAHSNEPPKPRLLHRHASSWFTWTLRGRNQSYEIIFSPPAVSRKPFSSPPLAPQLPKRGGAAEAGSGAEPGARSATAAHRAASPAALTLMPCCWVVRVSLDSSRSKTSQ